MLKFIELTLIYFITLCAIALIIQRIKQYRNSDILQISSVQQLNSKSVYEILPDPEYVERLKNSEYDAYVMVKYKYIARTNREQSFSEIFDTRMTNQASLLIQEDTCNKIVNKGDTVEVREVWACKKNEKYTITLVDRETTGVIVELCFTTYEEDEL